MQEQLRQEQQQFAFLAGCASDLVVLNGTAVDPDAGGIFCQQDEEAFLVLHGLSPLPATRTYQLWLLPSDGAPVSAGLLRVESAAIARQQVPLTADPLTYTAVGISIEPAGGSEEPTGNQIVLLGEKT
ncbi:MAG: anti-sigma factor [Caldilineaceae bacterium]